HIVAMSAKAEPDDPALPILRAAFRDLYNATKQEGWLVMDYWKDGRFNYRTLTGLAPSTVIMALQFSLAVCLAWGTYRGIAEAQFISPTHRTFQLKILKATLVPVVFLYLPDTCIFYFPVLGIPDFGISETFPVLISFFPAWDAIVIISLIKDYRQASLPL
ncbi:hypothetical protein PMAYCL1PPCAC_17214, partial [Pristionchus mayeri]